MTHLIGETSEILSQPLQGVTLGESIEILAADCIPGTKNVGDLATIRVFATNTGGTTVQVWPEVLLLSPIEQGCIWDTPVTMNPGETWEMNCNLGNIPSGWAGLSIDIRVVLKKTFGGPSGPDAWADEVCPRLLTVNPVTAAIGIDSVSVV